MDHYQTRSWVSWHHHMAPTFMTHLFLMRFAFKKSSALTTAQARPLVAQVLEDEQERKPDILSAIADRQQRNYVAYCSHRRRTLKRNA
jgi:hypothetical protein